MAFDTAASILNDAAVELGLYATDVADPYDTSDVNLLLLRRLLKGLGQDLARDFKWSHLQKEATLTTVAGESSYDLPEDFGRIIDQTQWDRTNRLPLGGPANAQQWQFLKAVQAAGVLFKIFRTVDGVIRLFPEPTSIVNIRYEYVSRFWVAASAIDIPEFEEPTDSDNVLYFDRRLLVLGLKLYFRQARGFDTTSEQSAFDRALARAQGGDGAAPILSLNGGSGVPLLGPSNVPGTGFGS